MCDLERRVTQAVSHFWRMRDQQATKQIARPDADRGARSAVTGGAQMDGFLNLLAEILRESGVHESELFFRKSVELPGFFRPTKEWDLLIVREGHLLAAIEVKSQVGPSFGNNFNNRTEEAMGSALDIWTAYREGAFGAAVRPWLGYLFLLEDCQRSRTPVAVREPHFRVFPEFVDASYCRRYELFCKKLVMERHYNATAFLVSSRERGIQGQYTQPCLDLTVDSFVRSLVSHIKGYTA